ncbi:MAG: LysR family transcriptional regulator [Nannocystis sp.]|nr:LysR family transcriptional regulator [Nannocystis sp.]
MHQCIAKGPIADEDRREPLRLDDVRLFLALCRNRTLGDAAEALGVDGSTVSRRLVALEDTLGASLFDRGRDGVSGASASPTCPPRAGSRPTSARTRRGCALTLAAITAGVGVGLVPAPSVAFFRLVPVTFAKALLPATEQWPVDDLFLVTHRALRDVPRVKVVWDRIVARHSDAGALR